MTSGNDNGRVFPVVPTATVIAFIVGIALAAKLVYDPDSKPIAIPDFRVSPTLSPAPSPFIRATPVPSVAPWAMTGESKRWMIAVTAMNFVRNGDNHDRLASSLTRTDVLGILSDFWDITDRDSAVATLDWLKTSGHMGDYANTQDMLMARTKGSQEEYAKAKADMIKRVPPGDRKGMEFALDFIWRHRNEPKSRVMAAWDCVRIASVARWSYSVGFITETEAWEYLLYSSRILKNVYSSWNEVGEYYLLGRTFWQHSADNSEMQPVYYWLRTNPSSPWKTIPWDVPLK